VTSPLQGLRVVVTRPAPKAQRLIDLLRAEGAQPVHFPTIEITDPQSWAEVDAAIGRLGEGFYEWAVFTSVNAVEKFASRMSSPPDFKSTSVAAVGPVTAESLERLGVEVTVVPEEFTAEAMTEAIGWGTGNVLLPRVQNAPRRTVEELRDAGWLVDEVVAYRNVRPASSDDPGDFDVVTFASGSAARNFAAMVGPARLTDPKRSTIVACIGPQTARTAKEVGLKVDVVAREHTDEGLVTALKLHIAER
jgi:uroporphyrinogen-III synthase